MDPDWSTADAEIKLSTCVCDVAVSVGKISAESPGSVCDSNVVVEGSESGLLEADIHTVE